MSREGTHMGGPIEPEQKARRRAKNARTAARSGQGSRPGCYAIAVERGDKDGCGHRGHGFKPRH